MENEPNSIYVENLHLSLSDDELDDIICLLKQNNVEINFIEDHEPKASFLTALNIFFNEPITKQIILNLLSSGAFEAIKYSLFQLYKNINKFKIIQLGNKPKSQSLNIKFKANNIKLNFPIPSNLNNEQFSLYMDMINKTIIELGKSDILKSSVYNEYIIEGEEGQEKLKVKTMIEYAREQQQKQKNKNMN